MVTYPSDWIVKDPYFTLEDSQRVPVTASERPMGTTPYFGANGVQGFIDGYTHRGEYVLIAEDGANDISDYPVHYVNGKIWVNNHAHAIRGITSVSDTKYLSYAFKVIDYSTILVGGTRAKLNGSALRAITMPLPNLPEQRAIAEVLSGFDEHLANLDELITKKKAVRDGVLDELLTGKQRLFGFNEGWSSLALEEVAAIYDGVHQAPDYEASGIRFVSVEDVFDLYGSAKFISQTSYLRDFKVPPSKGDVLMTRIGDIGTPAYISDEEPLAYYVSLALLKPIRINGLFLYYYIQSKSFQREVFDRSLLHATPKKINKGEIGFCLVTMPRNLEEQRAIASVLSSIDEEIRLLAEERAKVERLKLGAMDDLLTGRVRLPLGKEAA